MSFLSFPSDPSVNPNMKEKLCVCVCVNVCTYVSACNGDELSKASTIGLEDHYLERWVEGGEVSHCSRRT